MDEKQPRDDHTDAERERTQQLMLAALSALGQTLREEGIEPSHMLCTVDIDPFWGAMLWPRTGGHAERAGRLIEQGRMLIKQGEDMLGVTDPMEVLRSMFLSDN